MFFLDGNQLEVVNSYVYLGFKLTTSVSMHESAKHLASKGEKSLYNVLKAHNQLEKMCRQTFFKILDAMIQLVLLYAAEVWGLC